MMNGKKTVLATTILFFVLFTTSAAAIQITNVDIDPDEPYEGEGFDITAEAEDYQYMVEEVWIEWETQPSNWDQDSDSVYCGTETCSQEWEDIEFEESGEYEFEILAFSDHIADDDSYSGQVNVQEEDETEPEVEITEVEISEEELRPDEQVNMETTLENTGDADAEDISLEFVAEEDRDDDDEFFSIEITEGIHVDAGEVIDIEEEFSYEELVDEGLEVDQRYHIGGELFGTGVVPDRVYADDQLVLLEDEDLEDLEADFTFTPSNPEPDEEITFDASTSTGDIEEYEWELGDSEVKNGQEITHSYSTEGTYNVRLEVTDTEDRTDDIARSVTVSRDDDRDQRVDNVKLDNVPETADTGETIEIAAQAEGKRLDDIKIQRKREESILWRRVGEIHNCERQDTCTIDREYTQSEEGEVEFRAVANAGYERKVSPKRTTEFIAPDMPEEPVADFTFEPLNPQPDEEITFDGSISEGDIEEYEWELGDSTDNSGEEITHTYSVEGTYNVRLEITDTEDRTDSVVKPIEVSEDVIEEDPKVESVILRDLPDRHPTSSSIQIEGESTGQRLENMQIQYRPEDSSLWRRIGQSENCGLDSSCTLERPYEQSDDGKTYFRVKATAGTEEKISPTQSITFYRDSDEKDPEPGQGQLKAKVQDKSGEPIRNARVRAENSETKTRYTNSQGKVYMNLRENEYSLRVSKTGYTTQTRTTNVYEDEQTKETFTLEKHDQDPKPGVQIRNIQHDSKICRGEYLPIDVTLYNGEETTESVKITAQGIGSNPSKYMVLESGEERTKTVTATNVDRIGKNTFNIEIENGQKVSQSRTVNVEDCTTQVSTEATGLTLDINPREVNAGQTVTASGYLDGLRGQRGEITIKADGRTVARTNNDRDGYYQTYFRVHNPGEKTITAEAQGLSQRRTLTVNPTVHVESISMPDKVLKGEEFEICAEVNTQTTARVILENREGEVLEARDGRGETCFTTTARESGEKEYTVRAFVSGNDSSAARSLEVMESGAETRKFPDVLATQESGSGEFKVELYNTEDTIKEYQIEVSGIDRNWLSQSSREVHLSQGERKTVYFYLTPQVKGTYHPEVEITEGGETVFEDDVMVQTRGSEYQTRKTLVNRLKNFFRL